MRVPQSTLRVGADAGSTPDVVAPRVSPVQDQTGEQISMFGQGMAQAGAGVSRVADFLQDEMDDAVSQSVFNSYDEQSRQVAQKFRDSTGQDAITTYDQTVKRIATMRKDAEKRLQTQRQRQLFAARADSRDISLRGMLDGHAADQTRIFKIGALDAGSKNAVRAYLQAPVGSDEAEFQRAVALRQKEEALRALGKSPEEIGYEKTVILDEMHTGVLNSITQQDPKTAKAYLDKHRGEILPSSLKQAEANLERASLTETATRFMMDAERQAAARGGTPAEQQAYAQALADASYQGRRLTAEEYERTTQKIQQRFHQKRKEVALLAQDALGEAEKILSQNLDLRIDDLPQRLLKPIEDGGHRDTINRFANLHRYVTDPEQFNATMAMGRDELRRLYPSAAEFGNYIKSIASGQGQQRLMAHYMRELGDPGQQADAARLISEKQEAENWIRSAFKADLDAMTGTGAAGRQQEFVDQALGSIDKEWTKYQKNKNISKDTATRGDFSDFLDQMAREKVRYQGRDVPLFSVPEGQQKLIVAPKYRGEENVPVIRIPVSVTWESNGGPRTDSRDLFLDAMVAGGRSLDEAYEAWGNYVAAKESTAKARVSFDVDADAERMQREQDARVLRMGAGGKR